MKRSRSLTWRQKRTAMMSERGQTVTQRTCLFLSIIQRPLVRRLRSTRCVALLLKLFPHVAMKVLVRVAFADGKMKRGGRVFTTRIYSRNQVHAASLPHSPPLPPGPSAPHAALAAAPASSLLLENFVHTLGKESFSVVSRSESPTCPPAHLSHLPPLLLSFSFLSFPLRAFFVPSLQL